MKMMDGGIDDRRRTDDGQFVSPCETSALES